MTLQEAKEQIAGETGYESWEQMENSRYGMGGYGWQEHQKDHDKVALLMFNEGFRMATQKAIEIITKGL